jgi:hypothetical protein
MVSAAASAFAMDGISGTPSVHLPPHPSNQPGGASGEYHGLFHVSTTPPRPTRPHAEVILYQVRAHHAEVILYEVGAPLVYLGKITTHSPIVVHASEQRNYY